MNIKINNCKLSGSVFTPPSKSLTHRAIILAGLSNNESKISNIIFSDDIKATLNAMKIFDIKTEIVKTNNMYSVIFNRLHFGNNRSINNTQSANTIPHTVDCNESGSTLRFLLPLATLRNAATTFVGNGNLPTRPLDTYTEIFKKQKMTFIKPVDKELPYTINDTFKSYDFCVDGHISSQFITGLLLTIAKSEKGGSIKMRTPLQSKAYVDLTVDLLKKFGVEVINENYKNFKIIKDQKLIATNYSVEGDFSQVAFWALAGIMHGNIKIDNINLNSKQGDRKIIEVLKTMGIDFMFENNSLVISKSQRPKNATIDLSEIPDLGPALACIASLGVGKTTFVNAKRLRIKECDRINAIVTELEKLGVETTQTESSFTIIGTDELVGDCTLDSWGDHRIAMSLAILATKTTRPVVLKNADVVKKSYPHFWEDFQKLGGKIKFQ